MTSLPTLLITLGSLFILGLATDYLGRRTRLPRVTLLLVFGMLMGPVGLDLLPSIRETWFPAVTDMALVMVGFLLGESFIASSLRRFGKMVFWFSAGEAVLTALVVAAGLLLAGVPTILALILGGIAPATDPAATMDAVHEVRADGPFTRVLAGIVAVDDAWGLMIFSLMLTVAQAYAGLGFSWSMLATGAWEIGGALLLGVGLGIPLAYLTGRLRPGEPTLVEALGGVFLCGGLALWMETSFLLAAMAMGATVANLARHHKRPFHAIEGVEWPFMILFFVFSGSSLRPEALGAAGALILGYVVLRAAGRMLGALAGGLASAAGGVFSMRMGLALMPQAGVALGMALVAVQRMPELTDVILPVVVASTIVFEILGPVLTRLCLVAQGEARALGRLKDKAASGRDSGGR